MPEKNNTVLTGVEKTVLKSSPFDILYPPAEKINTIVVDNFPDLGKLTALRFLEWVQENPEGVISLPTGKTPEYFIKWINHIMNTWNDKNTQLVLETGGLNCTKKPEMKGLKFVQIDEFYPINPWQHNSFYFYVNKYYIDGFGLDTEKALLIDCTKIGLKSNEKLEEIWPDNEVDISLRYSKANTALERKQKKIIEKIDQWCLEYEDKIRDLGGIGFFLGGIGPDGHVGFNVRGSDHYSTTRLTPTNFETQAAAAGDLGGIEISRKRLVITIGLGTITYNPKCTAIIIAAGAAKAQIVARAVQEEKNILFPATSLHSLKNARFYITKGAAESLKQRQLDLIVKSEKLNEKEIERYIIGLSMKTGKSIPKLDKNDIKNDPFCSAILEKQKGDYKDILKSVHKSLAGKIEKGIEFKTGTRFLHTEPHHDDLMLGCLPYIVRHTRDKTNHHYYLTLTSGFTSVSNNYMKKMLIILRKFIDTDEFSGMLREGYFNPDNEKACQRDVWQYLDGVAGNNNHAKNEGTARRMFRNLVEVFDEYDLKSIKNRIKELESYFETQYPGKKDLDFIQKLKGMCREWEAECLWGYFGWDCSNVLHLRLGFYTGDIFTEEPTMERDVEPVLRVLEKANPDVVTVALDPEASGPDTHYKVLQAITEALKKYEEKTGRSDIIVLGYRNVWYRFNPGEANFYVPVSLNMFTIMQSAFMNTFISQKEASFPSYEHDGPFSELAAKIQVEQYQMIKQSLGREWFYENPSALIRATRGLVFLKEMTLEEFYQQSRELKHATEKR